MWLGLAFIGALLLTFAFRVPGYIHHDTTEIAMWAHSGWALGFWKHPPLLPWLVRTAAIAVPFGPTLLLGLTAALMTLGAWAVWQIALMSRTPAAPWQTGAIALALCAALPFSSVMATKLNHNSGLIALWALTTLAFLRALDRPTALRGALFGLAAAAAVVTKYYSGLLLAGCVIASFAQPRRALAFYRGPAPYVAVAVFALAIAPHALWLLEHRASTLTYAFNPGAAPGATETKRGLAMALSFAVQAPLIAAPMLLTAWLIRRAAGSTSGAAPHRFERELVLLAAVPFAATVLLTAAFNLRGAIAWAMPVFACMPAVVAARIGTVAPDILHRAAAIAVAIVLIVAAGAQVAMHRAVARGADGIAEPRRAIVEDAARLWRQATGERPLVIVGGDARLTAAATVFLPEHPLAWPAFDAKRAPWVDATAVATHGMVALCQPRDEACLVGAKSFAPALTCLLRHRVTYLGAIGPERQAVAVVVPPAGMQLPAAFACPAVAQ